MRIFLDANVLFAASNPASPTGRLIQLLIDRGTAVTCDYACEEAHRNIETKWPARGDDFALLIAKIEVAPTRNFPLGIQLAEKDVPILSSAIQSGCTHLATGDKRDFGHLFNITVQGVTIITLLRLAELLTGAETKDSSRE